jgi:hypothetical protein
MAARELGVRVDQLSSMFRVHGARFSVREGREFRCECDHGSALAIQKRATYGKRAALPANSIPLAMDSDARSEALGFRDCRRSGVSNEGSMRESIIGEPSWLGTVREDGASGKVAWHAESSSASAAAPRARMRRE